MIIKICNRYFDANDILSVIIRDREVLLDTKDDSYRILYSKKEDITQLKSWLKFRSLTKKDIMETLNILIIICDFFINTKEQCESCPLKKRTGCVFTKIPIDWEHM